MAHTAGIRSWIVHLYPYIYIHTSISIPMLYASLWSYQFVAVGEAKLWSTRFLSMLVSSCFWRLILVVVWEGPKVLPVKRHLVERAARSKFVCICIWKIYVYDYIHTQIHILYISCYSLKCNGIEPDLRYYKFVNRNLHARQETCKACTARDLLRIM